MPESIISQFRREYNSPIETDRQVNNINARDAINILTRWEGMNVYVISEGITYSLVGGLDNTNWVAVAGIAEAPIDGASYIRKDGGWVLMPTQKVYNFSVGVAGLVDPASIKINNFSIVLSGDIGLISGIIEVDDSAIYTSPSSSLTFTGIPDVLGSSWIFGFCELTFSNQRYDNRKCRFVNSSPSYLAIEIVIASGTYSSVSRSSWIATSSTNARAAFSIPFKLTL